MPGVPQRVADGGGARPRRPPAAAAAAVESGSKEKRARLAAAAAENAAVHSPGSYITPGSVFRTSRPKQAGPAWEGDLVEQRGARGARTMRIEGCALKGSLGLWDLLQTARGSTPSIRRRRQSLRRWTRPPAPPTRAPIRGSSVAGKESPASRWGQDKHVWKCHKSHKCAITFVYNNLTVLSSNT